MNNKPLTDKQQAFIAEYMINGHNASQAYKKAYPNTNGGWNKLSARLMARDGIRKEIDRKMAELADKMEYTVEQCQKEYEEIRAAAIAAGQLSAAATAVTGKARLYGMDKQTQVTEHVETELTKDEQKAVDKATAEYKRSLVKAVS
jgi:phage terminase small subunit